MPVCCETWLKKFLSEKQPCDVKVAKYYARQMGFTRGQLNEARKNLGVVTTNNSICRGPCRTKATVWYWSLKI